MIMDNELHTYICRTSALPNYTFSILVLVSDYPISSLVLNRLSLFRNFSALSYYAKPLLIMTTMALLDLAQEDLIHEEKEGKTDEHV
jgi:hypothetical protein